MKNSLSLPDLPAERNVPRAHTSIAARADDVSAVLAERHLADFARVRDGAPVVRGWHVVSIQLEISLLVHGADAESHAVVLCQADHLRTERGFFIDNLLARIHSIIEIILADRPCTMRVWIPFSSYPHLSVCT